MADHDAHDHTGITGVGGPPDCYEHILTAPVTIVNANTFYNALTLTPAAGTYLVVMTMDISQVHAAGSNVSARLVYNGATIDAHNTFVGAGGGNAGSLVCMARVTVNGSLAITGDGADNRGSSDGVILDQANVNGTADKCTRMSATRITSA